MTLELFVKRGMLINMISSTILNNGIRVVSQRVEHMHTVTIGVWVANGSRHESAATNGVAHFIEHLLFKGTARRTARQISMEMDSMGGMLNAFTGHEYVCYYAKVLSKFLPRATDILSDIFLHSVFPAEEIERERKVILQEIKMRDDSPDDYIHDQFHKSFWDGHSLGFSIPGTKESVSGLTREQIIDYKNSRYRPKDIIISAAGNVRHEELLALIESAFSDLRSDWASKQQEIVSHNGLRVNFTERDMEQTLLCLGTGGLSQSHPDRFALFLMNTILGGGMSSRLFQEVREKRGMAYSIYSYIISHFDTGALVVYAGTEKKQCREVVEIALDEMRNMKREQVTQDELDSAREQLKGKILMSLESSDSLMTRLAKNEIYLQRNQSIEEILSEFDKVTTDDVKRLAETLFDGSCINLEVVGRCEEIDLSADMLAI